MRRTNDRSNWCMKGLAIALICSILLSGTVFSVDNNYIEKGQNIGPGTYYRNLQVTTATGKFSINMVEAVIGTEYLKLEVSDSGKPIVNQTVLTQALKKSDTDKRVIGGVNGDFFDMTLVKGLPYSTSIIDKEIKSAVQSCSVLTVYDDGSCAIDKLNMTGNVVLKDNSSYAITAVNKLRWNNQIVVYTPSYGTSTKNTYKGVDLIVRGVEMPIQGNKQYTGTIDQIIPDAGDTVIPADAIVISGHGAAATFLSSAVVGDTVSFNVDFDKPNIKYAVSGSPRLIENGQISPDITTRPDGIQRHPRTVIGTKGDKLYMVAIDGRRPGVSDGMTLMEAAQFLLGQGIENAMNFDGGGSTTMVARTQGTVLPHLINVPSDGKERAIGNTLLLVSEAPVSEPAYIRFPQDSVKIFTDSTFKTSFFVMDKYFNLVQQDITPQYSTDENTAKTAPDGTYTSGAKAGKSYLQVAVGNATGKLPVEIVDKVSKIQIANDYIFLDPGETVQLNLKAYDANGGNIIINPSAVKWTVTGGTGTVDKNGLYTAGKKNATGKVSVKIGTVAAELGAQTGKTPIVLSGFENASGVTSNTVKAQLTLKATAKGEPVKSGKAALKLDYKLKQPNNEGTSVVYSVFKQPIKVIGKPIELGMWVYGDASNHWLRGVYSNAAGEEKVFNFTAEESGINWKGWKFVYAEIPADEKFPISVKQVYMAEPQKDNKTDGKIYIDDLTAIYKYDKDYYSPEVTSSFTTKTANLDAAPAEFYFDVFEKGSGLNPSAVKLYLNDGLLPSSRITITKTGTDTARVSYKVSNPLSLLGGEYNIRLVLKDKAGNALNPEYKTTFTIPKK